MKPVERTGYIDLWIIIQLTADGKFYVNAAAPTASTFGSGFYVTERDAQHQQTVELMKGNKCEIFHLEYPIK